MTRAIRIIHIALVLGLVSAVYAGAPTVVLGPGEPQQAHQTDEYCSITRILQSVEIYEELIRDWCGI